MSSPSPRKARKSAAGRKLMRWDPERDQFVLLLVEYHMSINGQAIPWDAVARDMVTRSGSPITGEAIKQHLVKLRRVREAAGHDVPPKLEKGVRRKIGNATAEQSTANAPNTTTDDTESVAVKKEDDPALNSSLLWTKKSTKTNHGNKAGNKNTTAPANKSQKKAVSKKTPVKRARKTKKRSEDEDSDSDFETPYNTPIHDFSLRKRSANVNYSLENAEDDELLNDSVKVEDNDDLGKKVDAPAAFDRLKTDNPEAKKDTVIKKEPELSFNDGYESESESEATDDLLAAPHKEEDGDDSTAYEVVEDGDCPADTEHPARSAEPLEPLSGHAYGNEPLVAQNSSMPLQSHSINFIGPKSHGTEGHGNFSTGIKFEEGHFSYQPHQDNNEAPSTYGADSVHTSPVTYKRSGQNMSLKNEAMMPPPSFGQLGNNGHAIMTPNNQVAGHAGFGSGNLAMAMNNQGNGSAGSQSFSFNFGQAHHATATNHGSFNGLSINTNPIGTHLNSHSFSASPDDVFGPGPIYNPQEASSGAVNMHNASPHLVSFTWGANGHPVDAATPSFSSEYSSAYTSDGAVMPSPMEQLDQHNGSNYFDSLPLGISGFDHGNGAAEKALDGSGFVDMYEQY